MTVVIFVVAIVIQDIFLIWTPISSFKIPRAFCLNCRNLRLRALKQSNLLGFASILVPDIKLGHNFFPLACVRKSLRHRCWNLRELPGSLGRLMRHRNRSYLEGMCFVGVSNVPFSFASKSTCRLSKLFFSHIFLVTGLFLLFLYMSLSGSKYVGFVLFSLVYFLQLCCFWLLLSLSSFSTVTHEIWLSLAVADIPSL